jgi:hypothetical protein
MEVEAAAGDRANNIIATAAVAAKATSKGATTAMTAAVAFTVT